MRHHACRFGGFRGLCALYDHIVAQVYHDGGDGGLRARSAVKMGRCGMVAGARVRIGFGDGVVRFLPLVVDVRAHVRHRLADYRLGGVDSVRLRGYNGLSDA